MKRKERIKRIFVNIFYVSAIVILSGILVSLFLFIYFARDLPRPETYSDQPRAQPTEIYDRTGENVLYTIYGEEKRRMTNLDNVPDHFVDALLTAEDSDFRDHFGVDFRGIGRSLLANIQAGRTVAGGSTISQQFVRSAFLTPERHIMRKVREVILTLELERRYSKDEILEFYLNQIPFGSNAYGIEAAAQNYFNKTASELTVAESATLVSLIPSPSYLSPYGENLDELLRRKDHLLERMYQADLIDEEEKEEAQEEELVFHRSGDYLRAPHFVMQIKERLERKYGEEILKKDGLEIHTTIDLELQRKAEEIVENRIREMSHHNAHNAGMVVIDPHTGEILAMVGSADYFAEPFPEGCTPGADCRFSPYTNVVTSRRQPGSAFKPFVYARAFEEGYTPDTTVIDERTNFGTERDPYIPRNYDGEFRGEVTLRQSLAQSLNIPSIKVLDDLAGLRSSVELARDLGVDLPRSPDFYGLPLVLGGGDVRLLDITSAYGVFATEGYKNSPISVLKITDKDGNIIEENTSNPQRVMDREIAKKMTDIMSDNEARAPVFGENSPLHFPNHEVASKTGSTQRFRDAWTIGYDSSKVVGVWVGNNDNTPMRNAPGVSVAAPMWRDMMEYVIER